MLYISVGAFSEVLEIFFSDSVSKTQYGKAVKSTKNHGNISMVAL